MTYYKHFKHLHVPDHWEHYWSKYPQGYTIMEALISWVSQVDLMTDNVNDWNNYLNQFVDTFDTKLQDTAREMIQELYDSGAFAELTAQVITVVQDQINAVQDQIDDISDTVDEIAYSIKSFGAVGDGVTDDTLAFETALMSGIDRLFIPVGTYIINVPPRENQWTPIFETNVCEITGVKGQSIIKLGSGNGDARDETRTGFTGLLSYKNVIDKPIKITGLVFDHNIAFNPVYHPSNKGRFYMIPEGNRQCMVEAENCSDFMFTDNKVIDNQGTNIVVYLASADNTKSPRIDIFNNEFVGIGRESGFGIHDYSTLYVHALKSDSSHNAPFAYIYNNRFVGYKPGAPNAYTGIEVGVNALVYNNHIENFWTGILLATHNENVSVDIYDNTLINVADNIQLWAWRQSDIDLVKNDVTSLEFVHIHNNRCKLDPSLLSKEINYTENEPNENGDILHKIAMVNNYTNDMVTDWGSVVIENNHFELTHSTDYRIDRWLTKSCIPISFMNNNQALRTTPTTCDNIIITNNTFHNLPLGVVYISSFSYIKNMEFTGNKVSDCMLRGAEVPARNTRAIVNLNNGSDLNPVSNGVENIVFDSNNIETSEDNIGILMTTYFPGVVTINPSFSFKYNVVKGSYEKLFDLNNVSELDVDNKVKEIDYVLLTDLRDSSNIPDDNFNVNLYTDSLFLRDKKLTQHVPILDDIMTDINYYYGDKVYVDPVVGQPLGYINTKKTAGTSPTWSAISTIV